MFGWGFFCLFSLSLEESCLIREEASTISILEQPKLTGSEKGHKRVECQEENVRNRE